MDKLGNIIQLAVGILALLFTATIIIRMAINGSHIFLIVCFIALAALSIGLIRTTIKEMKQ